MLSLPKDADKLLDNLLRRIRVLLQKDLLDFRMILVQPDGLMLLKFLLQSNLNEVERLRVHVQLRHFVLLALQFTISFLFQMHFE